MIAVIQCAGTKQRDAGTLKTRDGKSVKFVARPDLAPTDQYHYALPDALSDQGMSWRDVLLRYNEEPGNNPLGLLPAYRLYDRPIYQRLADHVGIDNLYILSAGWGLIRADFLTPDYDITFSAAARGKDAYKRRKKADRYEDFDMLPDDVTEPVIFFGGNDYLSLFLSLTDGIAASRVVAFASAKEPSVPGCIPLRYETNCRTNWHYGCAEDFIDGVFRLPDTQ